MTMPTEFCCISFTNFRFNGRPYQITRAGIDDNGQPYATISPDDPIFHQYLLKHIQRHSGIVCEDVSYPQCFLCFSGHSDAEKAFLTNSQPRDGQRHEQTDTGRDDEKDAPTP